MKRFGGDNNAQYDYEWELNEYNKLNRNVKRNKPKYKNQQYRRKMESYKP